MKEFTVCVQSLDLKSRLRAAAMLMQASLHELSLERLINAPAMPSHWVLVDAPMDDLHLLISRFERDGLDPSTQLIRFIDKPWQTHIYHDLPIFATMVMPPDPLSLVQVLERIMRAQPLRLKYLTSIEAGQAIGPFDSAFIRSRPMQQAVTQLQRLCSVSVDTVLLGPTGAGKDTTARWLHEHSGVSGAFMHINCAALPEQLFEAELFGVTAGAFTGAQKDRPGKLELADDGTLYLDEIDSLPLACQAKLLNALQYRGATRLGGSKFYTSSFRVIASTKVEFTDLIRKGLFREDLYFRLNVSQVRIPALNERLEDIIALYQHFLGLAAAQFRLPVPKLSPEAIDVLLSNPWPGNVRELNAYAQRHVLGLYKPELDMLQDGPSACLSLKQRVLAFERAVIEHTLQQHGGCAKTAAAALGMPPHALYYRKKRGGELHDAKSDHSSLEFKP